MAYFHVDARIRQTAKHEGAPCGDTCVVRRGVFYTTIILADGIGSGVKAHIASQMSSSRLAELLAGGLSLREAFLSLVSTMSAWRDHSMPFSAFLVLRVMNNGAATILNYEMPDALLVNRRAASVIRGQALTVSAGLASEAHFQLAPLEGVLLMSDGITQSGMGGAFLRGWGVPGVGDFLGSRLVQGVDLARIPDEVMAQADIHDGAASGDDKTVVLAHGRSGLVVEVFTGPPVDRQRDREIVEAFCASPASKVVCGATTAEIVARNSGRKVAVEQRPASYSTPPRYFIPGIDMVTEGAVTLTQTYNIIEEPGVLARDSSAAAALAALLQSADFIRFTVGLARNPANADIVYRKQGILPREKIVPLLASKLERLGKLVTIDFC
ncbi:MAG: SpoIIE family protein phosphatase [Candidatus Omnitrophica bacterium]|nr:SpoIIE family protein phosphatase [Candidatus Omnitrophota bacterium]